MVTAPLLYLTLCSLRNGPSHVPLADTMHEERSTVKRPIPANTDQARNGLHPVAGGGDDDYGKAVHNFGILFS